MVDDISISVKNVSKDFRLPHEKVDSVKSLFVNPFRSRTGVEVQHALKDISFDVKKGEFFGIVGRNGSGKSTLLKIIAGIYKPTAGSVSVNGRLVPFIELGVGFNPELTGRENVFLNGALMGFSPKEIKGKYKAIVNFAELERFMDQKLKNYSSGMQVRLAFSVATILAESDVLLIDEVLAVGDADFQRKCFEYFKTLKRTKKSVIFVTHDMNAVIEYCDRAILIEGGEIIKQGLPEKVATAYKKLFQQDEDEVIAEKSSESESERWGDGAIILDNPKLSKVLLKDNDDTLVLTVSARSTRSIDMPIFGFSISSPDGDIVLGMNNEIKKKRVKSLHEGETLNFSWKIPNVFSDGTHQVNLDATYNIGTIVADRWDNALSFKVAKNEKTPYVISPRVELDIQTDQLKD